MLSTSSGSRCIYVGLMRRGPSRLLPALARSLASRVARDQLQLIGA